LQYPKFVEQTDSRLVALNDNLTSDDLVQNSIMSERPLSLKLCMLVTFYEIKFYYLQLANLKLSLIHFNTLILVD